MKDIIIIGAGPAGLSAALNAAHLRLNVLVLESNIAGGLLAQNYPWKEVDSYLGMCRMTAKEVARLMVAQVRQSTSIHENEQALEIKKLKTGFRVKTINGEYTAKAVILAIGIMGQPRSIGIEGECLEGVCTVIKNPQEYMGKKVAVIGGGDTAVEYAIKLSEAGAKTLLIHRRDSLRATGAKTKELGTSSVRLMLNCEIEKIQGSKKVQEIICKDNQTGKKQVLKVDFVFKCIGNIPNREFLENIGVKMDKLHPKMKPNLETNIPGLYAAGDITGNLMKISEAVAEGNRALLSAYCFLKSPYWAKNHQ